MYTENDPVVAEDEDVENSQPEYGQDKGEGDPVRSRLIRAHFSLIRSSGLLK